MKIKLYITILLLGLQSVNAQPSLEDQLRATENPDYYVHVLLTGVVKQMVFPGPPHFLSVEDGDWPEPRTILQVDDESLFRLVKAQSRVTPSHYFGEFIDSELKGDEVNSNLVTIDSSFTDEQDNVEFYENKIITIDAVISAQPAHCHTPFVVEVAEVISHE